MKKWRDHLVNINKINFNTDIKITKELSYPHASNELTICEGFVNGVKREFVVKIARRKDANIKNEVEILSLLKNKFNSIPKVIDYNISNKLSYIVLDKVDGDRLSTLKNEGLYKEEMLIEFGNSLGMIHSLDIGHSKAPIRKFHDLAVTDNKYINKVNEWLKDNRPLNITETFCHGDHHYANLLWNNNRLNVVLDWELAGSGWKEFDMAWAMILRPGQKFFNTKKEEELFLSGYSEYSSYNKPSYNWCKVLVYTHFYLIGLKQNLTDYTKYITNNIDEIIKNSQII